MSSSAPTPKTKSLRSLPRQQQRLPGLDGITLLRQNLLHSRPNGRWVSPDGNLEFHGLEDDHDLIVFDLVALVYFNFPDVGVEGRFDGDDFGI